MIKKFKTTKEIKVSDKISEQIIGQDEALNIIKKAAKQRRNVLLIGDPGTGKSMLGQAIAELLPKEKLVDILSIPNPSDEHTPLIRTLPKGKGKELIIRAKLQATTSFKNQNIFFFILVILAMITPWWIRKEYGDIMAAASLIGSMIFLAAFVLFINVNKRMKLSGANQNIPKLLVDSSKTKKAPFTRECVTESTQSGATTGGPIGILPSVTAWRVKPKRKGWAGHRGVGMPKRLAWCSLS